MIFGYIKIGQENHFLSLLENLRVDDIARGYIYDELNKPREKIPVRFDIYGMEDPILIDKTIHIGNIGIDVWTSKKTKNKERKIAFFLKIPHTNLQFDTDNWDLEKNTATF